MGGVGPAILSLGWCIQYISHCYTNSTIRNINSTNEAGQTLLNTLTEPIVRIDVYGGGQVKASLAETYSLLAADQVEAFPALRPHQRHPWHAFLVQLGAIAMKEAGLSEPPEDPETWRDIIRRLTPDFLNDEPWRMVVKDFSKPAFLQPPALSDEKAVDYKNIVSSPDELDMLVTSKNHDLKTSIASLSSVEDWLLALITLQTSEGFSGAGNYGISRMNGGLGCRPAFSITPSIRPGAHVWRDILILLERRDKLMDNHPFADDGPELVWTLPWDGAKSESLTLDQLGPFYIEACRRVRLVDNGRVITHAVRATSKAPRIEARALKGVVGDPWTPTSKDGKSLTLSAGGFTYRRTAEYINTAKWEWPTLFKPTDAEIRSPEPLTLVARGMVRGQGKTEGYHERHIPIRPQTKIPAFGRSGGAETLGSLAEARVNDVGEIQRILRHAVSVFAAGGNSDSVSDDHRARSNPWANRLGEIVDRDFFEDLQEEFIEEDREERSRIRDKWRQTMIDGALRLLNEAEDTLPCPAIRKLRARVQAESVFRGRMRRAFPTLYETQETDDDHDASDG